MLLFLSLTELVLHQLVIIKQISFGSQSDKGAKTRGTFMILLI